MPEIDELAAECADALRSFLREADTSEPGIARARIAASVVNSWLRLQTADAERETLRANAAALVAR